MSRYTRLTSWCRPLGGTQYLSTKEVAWEVGYSGSGLWVVVPSGEVFDGSIPPWAWPLFSPHNPGYLKAFLLHDYLLKMGWDRVSAGAVFNSALKADGVSRLERATMSFVVMSFKYE